MILSSSSRLAFPCSSHSPPPFLSSSPLYNSGEGGGAGPGGSGEEEEEEEEEGIQGESVDVVLSFPLTLLLTPPVFLLLSSLRQRCWW